MAVLGVAVWWYARPAPAQRLYEEGRAHQAAGRIGEAIVSYEQSLARAPERVEIRAYLGQCLLADKRVAAAIPHLNAAVTAGVRLDVTPFDLARALASTGDRDAARRALARLTIPPQADTASFVTAGRMAAELGDPPLAIAFFRKVADRPDLPPDIAKVLAGLPGR